jgi:hypothetical protein
MNKQRQILALHKKGINKMQISVRVKCSRQYVYDVLAAYGLINNPRLNRLIKKGK